VPESVKDLLRLPGSARNVEARNGKSWIGCTRDPLLAKRVKLLRSISGVGEVTALTWALEICDPQRFPSIGNAVSCCGLCSALLSSADKTKRRPNSKQRNAHLQTGLMAASKLAPGWNRQLAEVYERKRKGGDCNQAAWRCLEAGGVPVGGGQIGQTVGGSHPHRQPSSRTQKWPKTPL
jgi:transposase